jgi:hypothetical protein
MSLVPRLQPLNGYQRNDWLLDWRRISCLSNLREIAVIGLQAESLIPVRGDQYEFRWPRSTPPEMVPVFLRGSGFGRRYRLFFGRLTLIGACIQ